MIRYLYVCMLICLALLQNVLVAGCGSSESCPANERMYNGICVCVYGFVRVDGACVPAESIDGDVDAVEASDEQDDDGDTADSDESVDGDILDGDTADSDGSVDGDMLDGDTADSDETADGDMTVRGTWYDSASGLTWENPPYPYGMAWQQAKDYCSSLSGGWRLPTISMLRSLIRGCPVNITGGDCSITDHCTDSGCHWNCYSCPFMEGPADGCYWPDSMEGACAFFYWSSVPISDYEGGGTGVWGVEFEYGGMDGRVDDGQGASGHVRCVRQ